jgi:SAM-dependent methyltransferase
MSVKPHENIRIQVVELLKRILIDVVRKRYEISRDLHSYMLLKLLESPEGINVLMAQEVRVGNERRAVDMALGGEIIFDFKSHEREFDDAERDAREKYWSLVSKARFFITTNWHKWRIYRVTGEGLELVEECDRGRAKELLRTQVIPQLRVIRIPPTPENIEALYKLEHERILKSLREVFNNVREDPRVKPLYEAYKSMMSLFYGGEKDEDFYVDLFMRHTYMHMAVLASLTEALGKVGRVEDVCSGALINIDVALPYLNWWRIALFNGDTEARMRGVLEEVVARASMVGWSVGVTEDVFRILYEFLVEPRVRRELGEYYTPLWLVEMMLNEFDVKDRIVLDPFCGSGTFLVKAFHRKVGEGEDPDKALGEVVGFDINPLAVAVARAELIIAYLRATEREPENPPHVYHVDTFATWFGEGTLPVAGLENLAKKAQAYLQILINLNQIKLGKASQILALLRDIEKTLTYAIRFSYHECHLNLECLEKRIENYLVKGLGNLKNQFIQKFLEHFEKHGVARSIADLIIKHGGNDVWSVVLLSIYVPILMTKFKTNIIVTNPPWIHVTEYKAPYSSKLREYMLKNIKRCVGEKAAQVVAGADIAAAALGKSIELAEEGVGFIMNKDQLFNHKSSMPAGIIATFCILEGLLRNKNVELSLFDFDFDVFQHGIYPAVIIVKKREVV